MHSVSAMLVRITYLWSICVAIVGHSLLNKNSLNRFGSVPTRAVRVSKSRVEGSSHSTTNDVMKDNFLQLFSKNACAAVAGLTIAGASICGFSNINAGGASTNYLNRMVGVQVAAAADTATVGKCLLTSCQKELAKCILNPKCLANVVCLNTCNGRSDEAECQIRCGDLFENDVVGEFNSCAVSQKKCVPQKQNDGSYPLPAPESLVKRMDASFWSGRWYISAGLNKAFDTFDCQVHFFTSPSPGKFFAKLYWRVSEPDGEFFTKDAVQRFVQDPKNPAHFLNHDNEFLHYKDDWYVLDYEPDDFALVYYRGSNDAWDGYGGAFLYTRSPSMRPELVPRLTEAMSRAQLPYQWRDFALTDNSCKPQAESATVLREQFARRLLITEEEQLQEQLTAVRNSAVKTIGTEEKDVVKSIEKLEKDLEKFQQEIVKDAQLLEREVEKDVGLLERELQLKK